MRILVPITFACLGCNSILGHSEGHLIDASASDVSADVSAERAEIDVDAATPLPNPSDIFDTKLALWLDADDTATMEFQNNRMMGWKDKSSFHNDADVVYTDMQTAPLQIEQMHGRVVIRMTGVVENAGLFKVADKPSVRFQTGDFLVAVIGAYHNTPGMNEWTNRAMLFGKVEGSWPLWGPVLMGNAYNRPLADGGVNIPESAIFGGVKTFVDPNPGAFSVTDGWNDDKLHFFAMRKVSADGNMYVHTDDQVASGPIDVKRDVSAIGSPIVIGGNIAMNYCCFSAMAGVLAEVVVVKGTIDNAQVDALEAYAKAKYQLY